MFPKIPIEVVVRGDSQYQQDNVLNPFVGEEGVIFCRIGRDGG